MTDTPVLVKIGGAVLESAPAALFREIARLRRNAPVVIVHGGGPQATRAAAERGHAPTIVEGRRVTTDADLDIHLNIVCGEINSAIVEAGRAAGLKMVSLPSHGKGGETAPPVLVEKRPLWHVGGRDVDFGHVGDVVRVNPEPIIAVLETGAIPVMTPSGADATGAAYNVNADTISLETAAAIGAAEILFVTEAGGVQGSDGVLVPQMTGRDIEKGIEDGWIGGGMIVKARLARQAVERGVPAAWIVGPGDLNSRCGATWVKQSDD